MARRGEALWCLTLLLAASTVGAELAPTSIVLPGVAFDSRDGEPAIAAGLRRVDGEAGLYLVQTVAPPEADLVRAVERTGARRLATIPPANLLVWADAGARAALSGLAEVRWVGPYHPAYRIPSGLSERFDSGGALAVLFDRTADGESDLVGRLERLTGPAIRLDVDSPRLLRAVVPLPAADRRRLLETVAALPEVVALGYVAPRGSIRDEMSNQIVADNAPAGEPVLGYAAFLAAKGLDGSGVTVGVVDTGSQINHSELDHDPVLCLNYTTGIPPGACNASGSTCGSHGTMTAGIVLGDGSSGVTHGAGFLRGLGVAPGALLLAQNFLCGPGSGSQPPAGPLGWLQLSRDQVVSGAYVSANSWGPSDFPLGYDAVTRQFDRMPRDGDPSTVEVAEPVVFVLSIMNGNGGRSTQGTPDEGKNLIRVGGTRNRTAGPIDNLCSCTAHGPALDGRRLPDLVAPGQSVNSTSTGNGHGSSTGTSFASPHVSGAVALIVEGFATDPALGYRPSPALIKAILVGSSDDLEGGLDADGGLLGHRPDDKQGWGRMNLDRAVAPVLPTLYWDQSAARTFTESESSFAVAVRAADPEQPMRVSLVWTDALGPGLGGATPSWTNDLDLEVGDGATSYLGNVFAGGWSTTGGIKDAINNVENVFVEEPGSTEWLLDVTATAILGDGVWAGAPSDDPADFDQDFALVCFNCVELLIFADGFEDGTGARWSSIATLD